VIKRIVAWGSLLTILAIVLAGCSTPTLAPPNQASAPAAGDAVGRVFEGIPSDLNLSQPRERAACPLAALDSYQACGGAFCIRSYEMTFKVNEPIRILWLPQNDFRGIMTFKAERFGGGEVLTQDREDSMSPDYPDYPSGWTFPQTGCWLVEATAGDATGSVAVWVGE